MLSLSAGSPGGPGEAMRLAAAPAVAQALSVTLQVLPLWMGFGYCPVMFSWLAELVPVFWLMELDLVSERQCRVQ